MKVLLFILVYYMDPDTRSLKLLWTETVPQASMDQCIEQGDRYKYRIEVTQKIEVRYFCKKIG